MCKFLFFLWWQAFTATHPSIVLYLQKCYGVSNNTSFKSYLILNRFFTILIIYFVCFHSFCMKNDVHAFVRNNNMIILWLEQPIKLSTQESMVCQMAYTSFKFKYISMIVYLGHGPFLDSRWSFNGPNKSWVLGHLSLGCWVILGKCTKLRDLI